MWVTFILLGAAALATAWLAIILARSARVSAAYRWTAIILGALFGGIMFVSALLENSDRDGVLLGIPLGLMSFAVVVLFWTYRWLRQQSARASTVVETGRRSIFSRTRRPEQ